MTLGSAVARLDIPKRSEDITPEWLTGALTSTGVLVGGRVTKIRRELLGEGEGYMGEINRLHLELAPAEAIGPKTVIAKQPIAIRTHRAQAELLGLYEREILFYRGLAAKLPVRTPRHYFSVMDPDPTTPESRERIENFVDTAPDWLLRLSLGFSTWLAGFSGRRYLLPPRSETRSGAVPSNGSGHASMRWRRCTPRSGTSRASMPSTGFRRSIAPGGSFARCICARGRASRRITDTD